MRFRGLPVSIERENSSRFEFSPSAGWPYDARTRGRSSAQDSGSKLLMGKLCLRSTEGFRAGAPGNARTEGLPITRRVVRDSGWLRPVPPA
jgi:hypothetical protein